MNKIKDFIAGFILVIITLMTSFSFAYVLLSNLRILGGIVFAFLFAWALNHYYFKGTIYE